MNKEINLKGFTYEDVKQFVEFTNELLSIDHNVHIESIDNGFKIVFKNN